MRAICIVVILLGVANAQPLPRAEDKAEADRLFEEGRALLEKGDRAEACKRFDLSFRKDPRAVGTMLNLGLCREEAGLVASAVRYYQEARDRARDQNLAEHQQAAERKIAMLSPRVPRLTIALAPGTEATARVLVDDTVIAQDQLIDVTVDPGDHALVVTAPGKLPYEAKLTVAESEHRKVDVPALQGATIVVREKSNRRFVGKVGVGVGAGLLVASVGLGLYARHGYWSQFPDGARDGEIVRDDDHDCWTVLDNGKVARQCNEVGANALDNARLVAHISTGAAIAGGVAVLAGAFLWATAPRQEAPPLALDVGPDHATVTVHAQF